MVVQTQTQNLVEIVKPLPDLVESNELDSLDSLSEGANVRLFVVLYGDRLVPVTVLLTDFGLQLVKKFNSFLAPLLFPFDCIWLIRI